MPHVIITGGSSGIGAAIADAYAARGYSISLVARGGERLVETMQALSQAHTGARLRVETADVCDNAALRDAVSRCEAEFGPCDVLIASAGIVAPGRFESLSAEDFDGQIHTNLLGSANAVRAVYAGIMARRGGKILLVSSGAGLIGLFGYSAYCASKFALRGLAEALRAEARPHGVQVSICFPPDTDTPQWIGEQTFRPAEAKAIIGTAKVWTARDAARSIVKGLEGGAFEIFLGFQLGMLGRYGSVFSPLTNRWMDWTIARAQRRATTRR